MIITEGKKWHHLAAKSVSALFRGIKSKHIKVIYCLNCFHSFRIENKLRKHENVYKNCDFCYVEITKEDNKILKCNYCYEEMPKKDNKILKYNNGEKYMQVV